LHARILSLTCESGPFAYGGGRVIRPLQPPLPPVTGMRTYDRLAINLTIIFSSRQLSQLRLHLLLYCLHSVTFSLNEHGAVWHGMELKMKNKQLKKEGEGTSNMFMEPNRHY